jgi:hypothetical protein
MKKVLGFKIIPVEQFTNVIIKRKTVCYFPINDGYRFYSYNDLGFKVSSFNTNIESGIKDTIRKAKAKPKHKDWIISERSANDILKQGDNRIFWWEKGGSVEKNQTHYKCDLMTAEGHIHEGVGDTLEEAIEDAFIHLDAEFEL